MRALLCLVAAALLPTFAFGESTLRLRVAWGGETPVRWVGQASLSKGELREIDLLSRERDAPGSIWLTEGAVRLAQPRPRRFDGFDITAAAPLDAILRLEFQAAGEESSTVVEAKLSELMSEANRSTIGLAGTTLLVHRAADDALRVELQRDSLIFSSGETLNLTVEPAIAGMKAGSTIDLVTKLHRGRRIQEVWSASSRTSLGSTTPTKVPVEIPLPDREGVYTVELIARTPPGNRSPFWGGSEASPLATRRFQVVVLGDAPLDRYVNANWQTLLEIDPANPSWWNRLPDWTRFDRLSIGKTAQQAGEPFRSSSWQGTPLAELPRSGENNLKWRAYPLPAAQVGLPHMVEVDLPADNAQRVAIHIYEPDSRGRLTRNGPGTGMVIDAWPKQKPGAKQQLKYLFWPRTNSPLLVVQNASQETPARYGTVRLRLAEPSAAPLPSEARLVAAQFTWDGFLERCGARATDSKGQPAIDDWVEFYTAAERLAELLELNGYNGALLNVLTDGGAAFDLGDDRTSTPVLNSNRVASGANDLPQVEPLDLLMRIFSRRGLRLAPTLNFSASLPSIEASLRESQYKTLEEYPLWTDLQNRPRTRIQADSPSGPAHYRISHPEVQKAIVSVVERLVQRVEGYSAFAGVGIELGPDSYLSLPAPLYGLTPSQVAGLATRLQTPPEVVANWRNDPQAIIEDASAARQWNEYRAEPSTRFFEVLANLVGSTPENRPLYLLTNQLLKTGDTNVRPALRQTQSLEDLYMERGVAIEELQATARVKIAPSLESTVGVPLADAAVAMELNSLAQKYLANHSHSQPHPIVATSLTASVPVPSVDGHAAGPPQQLLWECSGGRQNERLIDALRRDPGGPVIVGSSAGFVSGNQSARNLLTLVQALPVVTRDALQNEIDEQPVSAQAYQHNGETVALALNHSPWALNVTLTLDTPERTTGLVVSAPATTTPGVFAAGKHAWTATLQPYSAQAIKFTSEGVTIAGLRTDIGPEILDALSQRYANLEQLDLNPQNLPPYQAAPNPSFEQRDIAGNAKGWVAEGGVPTVESDLDGAYAAKLLSLGDRKAMSTEPFDSPETGQLAMTAYVRTIDITEDAVLRLIIEEADGSASPRFIELTGKRLLEEKKVRDWNGYRFGVEDLPLDTTAKIRVRFELQGVGEVWVDNLQFHDLVYPLKIYETESQQQVFALVRHLKLIRTALDESRYSDCLDLLDSYWSQFMLEHLPEIEESEPVEQKIAPNAPAAEASPAPRLTDRVRDLFRF